MCMCQNVNVFFNEKCTMGEGAVKWFSSHNVNIGIKFRYVAKSATKSDNLIYLASGEPMQPTSGGLSANNETYKKFHYVIKKSKDKGDFLYSFGVSEFLQKPVTSNGRERAKTTKKRKNKKLKTLL